MGISSALRTALLSTVLASSAVSADPNGQPDMDATSAAPARDAISFRDVARATTAGANDPREGIVNSGFELTGGVESGEIQLTLARERDNPRSFGETGFALVLKAPYSADDKRGFLITQNGVTGGFGADLSISGIIGSYAPPDDLGTINALSDKWDQKCAVEALQKGKTAKDDAEGVPDEDKFNNFCQKRKGMRQRVLGRYLTPEEIVAFNRAWGSSTGFVDRSILMPSLTGGFGIQDYTYRDPLTFAEQKTRKTSWSVTASLGYLPSARAPFFLVGYEYRRSYKASDEDIYCPGGASATPVKCTKDEFAPPKRNTDHKFFGLMRVLEPAGLRNVALELKAAYDIKDDIVGFEAPLYVFLDKDHKLRGGVRAGWDSDKKDVKFGVFIGVPFNFLNH